MKLAQLTSLLRPKSSREAASTAAVAVAKQGPADAVATAPPAVSAAELYINKSLALANERINDLRDLQTKGTPWEGWRDFTIARRVQEGQGQVSFYLQPKDGGALPEYKPGQYLTFKLNIAGKEEIRCYSLSDAPGGDAYRITVKRASPAPDAPPGKASVSAFLQDEMQAGATLSAKAPAGAFVLDMAKKTPVVLIGGGVGVTPFISMLNTLADEKSDREVHFFFAASKPNDFIMRAQLAELQATQPNLKVHLVASKPDAGDVQGVHFDHKGHVNMELLKAQLPKGQYDFYMCGPPTMMASLTDAFRKAGVTNRHIHSEAFGPAAKPKDQPSAIEKAQGVSVAPIEVFFVNSGKSLDWKPESGTLLEAAEEAGVNIPWMCRQGSCKGCACSLRSGSVAYPNGDPGAPKGKILPCVAVPLAGAKVEIVVG